MQSALAQKIISTTEDLLMEHELDGWTVKLGNAARTAGSCHYGQKVIRISLKVAQIVEWEEVHDTILHEVAHAIAGHSAGHGYEWRRVAREIGLKNPQRTASFDTTSIDPWVGTCPAGHTVTRPGAPRRLRSCALCHRGFSADHLLTWTKHGEEVEMPRQYRLELMMLQSRMANASV